jgi:hypothetical protein
VPNATLAPSKVESESNGWSAYPSPRVRWRSRGVQRTMIRPARADRRSCLDRYFVCSENTNLLKNPHIDHLPHPPIASRAGMQVVARIASVIESPNVTITLCGL